MLNSFIVILFIATCAFVFFSESGNRKFSFNFDLKSLQNILPILGTFALVYLISGQFLDLAYFAISFFSLWLIASTGYSQRHILILFFSFLLNLLWPNNIMPLILALIVWNIFHPKDCQLSALSYLSTLQWINLNSLKADQNLHISCILGFLAISLLVNWFKQNNSKFGFYMQTAIVCLGGLIAAFIIIENILLAHKLYIWGLLFGFGLIINSFSEKLPKWSQLALIGLATLLASRLVGTIGFSILAISTLSSWGFASGFWIARTLLQTFIIQYNSNITGLNLMHSYSSAALFAGILLGHLVLYWQKVNSYYLLLGGIFLAIFSNYFLHSEPTGSFLIAFTITSVCLTFLKTKNNNILIWPIYLISLACTLSNLLELGLEHNRQIKLIIFLSSFLILFIVSSKLYKNKVNQ